MKKNIIIFLTLSTFAISAQIIDSIDQSLPFQNSFMQEQNVSVLDKSPFAKDQRKTSAMGKLEFVMAYIKDTLGVYQNDNKTLYFYNHQENQTETQYYKWENNAWLNTMRDTLIYDTINYTVEFVKSGIYNGAWNNIERFFWQFDALNNLTSELQFDWVNSAWLAKRKNENTYSNGKIDTVTRSKENAGVLEYYSRELLLYNANGHLTQKNMFKWKGSYWDAEGINYYVNDVNGNLLDVWVTSASLDTVQRLEYFNDAQGRDTAEFVYFDNYNTGLELFSKQIKKYDHLNNRIQKKFSFLDYNNNWIIKYDFLSRVNVNKFVMDYTCPNGYENLELNNIIAEANVYYWHHANYQSDTKYIYHYSSSIGINEQRLSGIVVYPNPTSNNFILSNESLANATLEVYSINGALILKRKLEELETLIKMDNYSAGLYTLRVYNKSESKLIKILKN